LRTEPGRGLPKRGMAKLVNSESFENHGCAQSWNSIQKLFDAISNFLSPKILSLWPIGDFADLPDLGKERSDVRCQRIGALERREMPATRHACPATDISVKGLGE